MLPVLVKLGPFPLYSFGIFLTLGVLFGTFTSWRKAKEYHLDEEKFFDLVFSGLLGAILTGRAWYIATHFEDFGFNLIKWLWFTHYVGLSYVGALVGGGVVLIWVAKYYQQDVYKIFDLMSFGAALGLALGWFGAFLDGIPVGIRWDNLGIPLPGREGNYFPVQIVAILGFLILNAFLEHLEPRYRTFEWYRAGKSSAKSGFLLGVFLIFIGLIQVAVACLSLNPVLYSGLPVDGWLGLLSVFGGIVIIYHRSGRKLKTDLSNLKLFSH